MDGSDVSALISLGDSPPQSTWKDNWHDGVDRLRHRLAEGRDTVQSWSKKKQVGVGVVCLLGGVLACLSIYWCFSSSDHSAKDDGILAHCDPSAIPRVSYSVPNSEGFPRFWKDNVSLIPCKDAGAFNVAIVQQLQSELEKGLWVREGDSFKTPTKGGEHVFMNVTNRFALIAANATDSDADSDDSVSTDVLVEYFGTQFSLVKCLRLNETAPRFFACADAVLTSSIDDAAKKFFTSSPAAYMAYTQSKVLLFTLLLSDYEGAMRSVMTKTEEMKNTFRELLIQSENKNLTAMAEFMNGESKLSFDAYSIRVHEVMAMATRFLKGIDICATRFRREYDQTWSDCVYFYYPANEPMERFK